MLVLSLKEIRINLMKLSPVKTYDSTIFSKVLNFFPFLVFGAELSLSSIGLTKSKTFLTSNKNSFDVNFEYSKTPLLSSFKSELYIAFKILYSSQFSSHVIISEID